jgi:hypothetical protein
MVITQQLKDFIKQQNWIFAKTYADTWPHEYIVKKNTDHALFEELASTIETFGYEEYFYIRKQKYLDYGGFTYWHMENIINRCVKRDTYHRRKIEGGLPKN